MPRGSATSSADKFERIFNLSGAIVPVFTPFTTFSSINCAQIERYYYKLANVGVDDSTDWQGYVSGVFILGTTGEGYSLTCNEKIEVTREWIRVRDAHSAAIESGESSRRKELAVMVVVSATCSADVITLAQECARMGVDAIAVQPPLYYRGRGEDDVVRMIGTLVNHLPDMPALYYHIPSFTGNWRKSTHL